MVKENKDTEEKILDAAKDVFQKKGMSGARMQEIADKAGINKALLHYYYRTKEKLFEKVFTAAFTMFFPKVQKIIISDLSLFEKIRYAVENYIDLFIKHPYIPGFVINELNRNPKILTDIFERNIGDNKTLVLHKLQDQINEEIEKGIIHPIDVQSFMVNMLALCIFPIVAKPIVSVILFNNDQKEYKEFIKRRKTEVAEFIINSIKI